MKQPPLDLPMSLYLCRTGITSPPGIELKWDGSAWVARLRQVGLEPPPITPGSRSFVITPERGC